MFRRLGFVSKRLSACSYRRQTVEDVAFCERLAPVHHALASVAAVLRQSPVCRRFCRPVFLAWMVVGLLVTMSTPSLAGETLYNGIVLPDVWPPRRKALRREPMPIPYLQNPPKVILIDVGRQLLIDDFLIEQSDLARTFHRPTLHEINPVVKADQPWETSGESSFVAPFQGRVLYDPSRPASSRCGILHSTKGDYYLRFVRLCDIGRRRPLGRSRSLPSLEQPDAETVSPKKGTNLVIQGRRTCCNSLLLDHNAKSPNERFKMLSSDHGSTTSGTVSTGPAPTASTGAPPWSQSGPFGATMCWRSTIRFVACGSMKARIHGGTEIGRCRAYMERPDLRKDWPKTIPHVTHGMNLGGRFGLLGRRRRPGSSSSGSPVPAASSRNSTVFPSRRTRV